MPMLVGVGGLRLSRLRWGLENLVGAVGISGGMRWWAGTYIRRRARRRASGVGGWVGVGALSRVREPEKKVE